MVVNMRNVLLGIWLGAATCGAQAVSLGASHGTVVLGSTIDLAFEVRPDADTSLSASCISVSLVSGATPISDTRVHVTPMESGRTPLIRVQAFVPVDEPILTATVAVGCTGRVSRVYTFLADLPTAVPAQTQSPIDVSRLGASNLPSRDDRALALDAVAGAAAGGTVPDARARQRRTSARAIASAVDSGQAAAPRNTRPVAVPRKPRTVDAAAAGRNKASASASATPIAAKTAAADTSSPRLVMEPLDLWGDAPTQLQLTREQPQMSVRPSDAQRAESAALWQALNMPVADVQQFEERLKKLETDAQDQRRQLDAERAVAAELRQKLEQVQASSFSATLVYALAGLLLSALAGIAWLLLRTRNEAAEAWRNSVALTAETHSTGAAPQHSGDVHDWLAEPDAPAPSQPADAAISGAPASPTSAAPFAETSAGFAETFPAQTPDVFARQAVNSGAVDWGAGAKALQILPAEAMFDIQQQAEFFTSIGEHEQAIAVLRKCIAEKGEAAPLAYRDLLHLFYVLGRTDSFNQLRDEVHALFNTRVPEFSRFHQWGHGLEDYPEALAQIEAFWTSPEVLDLLDGFLFLRGKAPDVARFDPAAIDDLLLLQSIAQTTPAHQRGAPPPRARTTPRAQTVQQPAPAMAAPEFDLGPLDLQLPVDEPARRSAASQAPQDTLDLDLSDPQHRLTVDLSIAPATAPDAADASVALDLELQQIDKKRP